MGLEVDKKGLLQSFKRITQGSEEYCNLFSISPADLGFGAEGDVSYYRFVKNALERGFKYADPRALLMYRLHGVENQTWYAATPQADDIDRTDRNVYLIATCDGVVPQVMDVTSAPSMMSADNKLIFMREDALIN